MNGSTEATESSLAIGPGLSPDLERSRRKPGAAGAPVRLADGGEWLLRGPEFRVRPGRLTSPLVDRVLEQVFEAVTLGEELALDDVLAAAASLLLANYDLTEAELSDLLTVSPGQECQALVRGTVDALFGPAGGPRGYLQWVRASLLANGLGDLSVPCADLSNVMAVLLATGRTVPLEKFADACRLVEEQARLEDLI